MGLRVVKPRYGRLAMAFLRYYAWKRANDRRLGDQPPIDVTPPPWPEPDPDPPPPDPEPDPNQVTLNGESVTHSGQPVTHTGG